MQKKKAVEEEEGAEQKGEMKRAKKCEHGWCIVSDDGVCRFCGSFMNVI